MQTNKYKAYSLIEIIFVIGAFAAVATFLLPFAISQISGSRIRESVKLLESSIYSQRQNAITGQNSASYGVAFNANSYTLFEGDSLATASFSEQFNLSNGVVISEINLTNSSSELTFPSGTFRPTQYGTIVLSDGATSYTLEINSEGLIDLL